MQVFGKTVLPIIISASLLSGCSNESRNSHEIISESKLTFEQPNQDQAGFLNFNNSKQIIDKKVNNPVEEAIGKNLTINGIFNKGVTFTKNKGQLDRFYNIHGSELGNIEYYSRSFGGTAYFMKKGIGFGFIKDALDEQLGEEEHHNHHKSNYESVNFNLVFQNSNDDVKIIPSNKQEGIINYFKGSVDNHITDIASFETISYENIYDNIDLKYYQNNGELKYDYIVKAGGNIQDISMKYDGAKSVSLNKKGELEIETEWGVLIDKAPYSYQVIDGKKKEIDIKYFIDKKGKIKFKTSESYDINNTLVIDPPTMVWATYGTSGNSDGYLMDIAVDVQGNIYGTGKFSDGFPNNSVSSFQSTSYGGGTDAVVFKLSSDGTTMLYAGFVGGADAGDNEIGWGIDVNESGEAFIAGHVNNTTGFPFTANAIQTSVTGGMGIFVTKINAAGTAIDYSTLYGGNGADRAYSIAVDSLGSAYITGLTTSSSNFATVGADDETYAGGGVGDAFLLKVDPSSNSAAFCTYLGGTSDDLGRSVAVNNTGAYVTGATSSSSGISTAGSFDQTLSGGVESFVCKYDLNGSKIYGSYIGGDGRDKGEDIAVKNNGEVIVAGWTESSIFPSVNAIQPNYNGFRDGFLIRLSPDGTTVLNGTHLGTTSQDCLKNGNPYDLLVQQKSSGVDVSNSGEMALLITTLSTGLPLVNSLVSAPVGGDAGLGDAYVCVLNAAGDSIIFSTYYGGSANDYATGGVKFSGNDIFIAGSTHSSNIPTTPSSYQASRGGTGDIPYIVKYSCIYSSTINEINDSTVCEAYILPEITGLSLTGNEYYELDAGGILNAGDTITSSGIVRIVGSSISCVNSVAFYITVENSIVPNQISDSTFCEKYALIDIKGPLLTGNEFYRFKDSINLKSGDTIYESGFVSIIDTTNNCFIETGFQVTLEECDSIIIPEDSIINEIIIPTGFTPDNDGYNDIWDLSFLVDYPDANVQVYNRWGMQVYSSKGGSNYQPFTGEDLPVGSYPYIILLNDTDGSTFKGNLSLVR